MKTKFFLGVAAGLALIGGVLWGLSRFWVSLGDGVTGHGWVAYFLGGGLTLLLSAGLFSLTFYSARHG